LYYGETDAKIKPNHAGKRIPLSRYEAAIDDERRSGCEFRRELLCVT
jgi:hypothetical protein